MTSDLPSSSDSASIPLPLRYGVPMLKMTSKKIKQVIVRIEKDKITWGSGKGTEVPILSIRQLRLNHPPSEDLPQSRWITIVYVRASQWKVLHMTALTDETYHLWVDTLTRLVSQSSDRLVSQVTPADPDMMWIKQLWPTGAKAVDYDTAAGLCGQLGLVVTPKPSSGNSSPELDWPAFQNLVKEAQTRPEFDAIYQQMRAAGPLDRSRVDLFLRDVQKCDPRGIFETFAEGDQWTLSSLTDFLLSARNTQPVTRDMTLPLPSYFVSSSHNTYLVGEQWRGESSVEGYVRVLLANCRCVEVDCHDGEVEPQVYHRKTFTGKVSLREICQAINQYAFVTSPYPVIISAEVHCSPEQQDVMVSVLKETFGGRLVTALLPDDDGQGSLPSPERLKGRILFKAKPPKVDRSPPRVEYVIPESPSSTESDSGFARLARHLSISTNGDRPPFSSSLTDLLVYTEGVKYHGFSKLLDYDRREQFSVSERTALRIIKETQADWVKHNFTHISRVYPRASRLTSTNFDPIPMWESGCQVVALNWQTVDEGAIINHALFADGPGYVLKPPALRQKLQEPLERHRLRIRIISAQRLPPSSDVYVEVKLINDPSGPRKTEMLRGPTVNPHWNEAFAFDLSTTRSKLDLTFLHIRIFSRLTSSPLAQWVRPLATAPRGYHHLPLYDSLLSNYVFATLFVRIDLDTLHFST